MEKQKKSIKYSILEFTEYPGPRYEKQGDDSGEEFYKKKLKPLFEQVLRRTSEDGEVYELIIDLDNTAGYASSFLDEAFGSLVYEFTQQLVEKHLVLVSNQEPDWINIIKNEVIPEWETKRVNQVPARPANV